MGKEFLLVYRLCFTGPKTILTKNIYCEMSKKFYIKVFSEMCRHYDFSRVDESNTTVTPSIKFECFKVSKTKYIYFHHHLSSFWCPFHLHFLLTKKERIWEEKMEREKKKNSLLSPSKFMERPPGKNGNNIWRKSFPKKYFYSILKWKGL